MRLVAALRLIVVGGLLAGAAAFAGIAEVDQQAWPLPSALDWSTNWPYALAYLAVVVWAMLLPQPRFWYAVPLAFCWPVAFWLIV